MKNLNRVLELKSFERKEEKRVKDMIDLIDERAFTEGNKGF